MNITSIIMKEGKLWVDGGGRHRQHNIINSSLFLGMYWADEKGDGSGNVWLNWKPVFCDLENETKSS